MVSLMFLGRNASHTNRNVTLFTLEISSFFGMNFAFRISNFRNKFSVFDWNHYVTFGFISEMFSSTSLAKVDVANFTVKWRNRCLTHCTTNDILERVLEVHNLGTFAIIDGLNVADSTSEHLC